MILGPGYRPTRATEANEAPVLFAWMWYYSIRERGRQAVLYFWFSMWSGAEVCFDLGDSKIYFGDCSRRGRCSRGLKRQHGMLCGPESLNSMNYDGCVFKEESVARDVTKASVD